MSVTDKLLCLSTSTTPNEYSENISSNQDLKEGKKETKSSDTVFQGCTAPANEGSQDRPGKQGGDRGCSSNRKRRGGGITEGG